VDEAVLDTGAFQAHLVETGRRFRPSDWEAWVREHDAAALPGAVEFVTHAAERGVRIFFITNRGRDQEEATRRNLQALGLPVDADGANLLTLGEPSGRASSDKTERRRLVAASHRVVLIVGDDLNDFVPGSQADPQARVALARRWRSWWGTRWIIIPNPIYGGWERSLYGFDEDLPRPQVLRRKYEALDALDPDAN
jgi:acid phosphatase